MSDTRAHPEATAGTIDRRCPGCDETFVCASSGSNCWCGRSAPIAESLRADLSRRYGPNCLCPRCLDQAIAPRG